MLRSIRFLAVSAAILVMLGLLAVPASAAKGGNAPKATPSIMRVDAEALYTPHADPTVPDVYVLMSHAYVQGITGRNYYLSFHISFDGGAAVTSGYINVSPPKGAALSQASAGLAIPDGASHVTVRAQLFKLDRTGITPVGAPAYRSGTLPENGAVGPITPDA